MKRPIKMSNLTREEIQRVAEDIYIYGYPLLLMDLTKRTHTATPSPTWQSAPLNQFVHTQFLPDPHAKQAVHPNADCLRSSAWLDLHREPVVLSIPQSYRYYLLSFFSGWYEIFETRSPRNTGTQGGHLGFVAPRWIGRLPTGVTRIVAPTETVWIDGWFEVDGPEDVELVRRLQNQFRLIPLSEWDDPPMPHSLPFRMDVDQTTTPQEQVSRFDAPAFYTRLSRLMERNPVQACDAKILADFIRIGFLPCESFAFEMLPPDTGEAMHLAVASAQARIRDAQKDAGPVESINNWSLHVHPGRYETNYLDRAVASGAGVDTALAQDVLCFRTSVDHRGEPLKGAHQYVISFSPNLTPPVNAFWSITLYDSRQHLVPNSIHRNVIGDRDRLKLNADNSLSIHIQHDWPGTSQDYNWLPAPKEAFSLTLRMYWPRPEVLAGTWRPPAVIRTS